MASLYKKSSPPKVPAAVNLGINFAVGMGLFSFGGYKLDQKRGDGNLFTLLGMFLGLIYGGYEVWKLVRVQNEDDASSGDGETTP
jgi:hypothetical protein